MFDETFNSIGNGLLTEQIELGWYFYSNKKTHCLRLVPRIIISFNPDDDTNTIEAVKLKVIVSNTTEAACRSMINKMIAHKNTFLLLRGKGRVEVTEPKKIQYVSRSLRDRSDYYFVITVVGSPVKILSRLKPKISDLFKKLKTYVPIEKKPKH